MNFDWKELVKLASELASNNIPFSNNEAMQRTIINRLYYGCFGHTKKYLNLKFGFVEKKNGTDHDSILNLLHSTGRIPEKRKLYDLRKFRRLVDYESTFDINNLSIEACIRDAESIVNTLKYK